MIVKAEALWAEHICEEPMKQWSVGNETYAAALDHPDDGLDRAYGIPTPIAFDLEWYATAPPHDIADGYEQRGVVHGAIEVANESALHFEEVEAQRWHRWGDAFGPLPVPRARAHTGARAAFAFPDGTVADWVLTARGWADRDSGRE